MCSIHHEQCWANTIDCYAIKWTLGYNDSRRFVISLMQIYARFYEWTKEGPRPPRFPRRATIHSYGPQFIGKLGRKFHQPLCERPLCLSRFPYITYPPVDERHCVFSENTLIRHSHLDVVDDRYAFIALVKPPSCQLYVYIYICVCMRVCVFGQMVASVPDKVFRVTMFFPT